MRLAAVRRIAKRATSVDENGVAGRRNRKKGVSLADVETVNSSELRCQRDANGKIPIRSAAASTAAKLKRLIQSDDPRP
jgi:hypothetical protein